MRRLRRSFLGLAASSALALGYANSAQSAIDCSVDITRVEFGFIVEVGGGHGTLYCDGIPHAFRIGGILGGGMGMSGSKAYGKVRNLNKLGDFEGGYGRAEAQATAGVGVGAISLQNDKGVIMDLKTTAEGANLQLGVGGVRVRFE